MNAAAQGLDAGGLKQAPFTRPGREGFRLQPLRALRAVRRLIADKEDTAQVFEIMRAWPGTRSPGLWPSAGDTAGRSHRL
ncbi:hypothetical protein [Caulobacter sp. B11]|uniref:hypothetical protein n=1 Tax=Caulobacter sp. B11 TaxID=2048899 RepID=UPI001F1EBD34|nr:hypothetical protein [Caulobacter sp. B11]